VAVWRPRAESGQYGARSSYASEIGAVVWASGPASAQSCMDAARRTLPVVAVDNTLLAATASSYGQVDSKLQRPELAPCPRHIALWDRQHSCSSRQAAPAQPLPPAVAGAQQQHARETLSSRLRVAARCAPSRAGAGPLRAARSPASRSAPPGHAGRTLTRQRSYMLYLWAIGERGSKWQGHWLMRAGIACTAQIRTVVEPECPG
jgi:hypothetical protein